MSLLKNFYTDDILQEDYAFLNSATYYVPTHTTVDEIRKYIEDLPSTEEPEIFGLH